MKYGIYLPNFGSEASAAGFAELAKEAEASGWDGFFLWDHIVYNRNQKLPIIDPWVALTAMAVETSHIRLGTTVTPLARRRPWVLARQTASLDQLSHGRLILGIGLGDTGEAEFGTFGEDTDPKRRAEKLDEALDILCGLWGGKPFSYQGKHYQVQKVSFLPAPVQTPHIPIWVGGFWPNKGPFRRAARWDGMIPLQWGSRLKPADIAAILNFMQSQWKLVPNYDVVIINGSRKKPEEALKKIAAFEKAGATWWLESLYLARNSMEDLHQQIRLGPPA